ncbi:MAG: DUF3048 domain-containing protein [Trueperaceae bacterium]|nr:DUF3048 domain-containing protein [Trueperaceae bacterium]
MRAALATRVARLWRDPDRRRAAGLSLLLHALVLLALMVTLDLTPSDPPETYLVVDLGTPAEAEEEAPATADDAVAQPAPRPQVEADATGRPAPGDPATDAESGGDPAADGPPAAEAPAPPAPPERDAAAADAADDAQAATPLETPAPRTAAPEAPLPTPDPEVEAAVPEIETPDVQVEADAAALPVPSPSPDPSDGATALTEVAPDVEADARALAAPDAAVEAPATRGLEAPTPDADADAASVAAPTPSVGAPEGRDLDAPNVTTEVGSAQQLGVAPTASVPSARPLPTPSVQAVVREAPSDAAPGSAARAPRPDGPIGGDAARPGQPDGDPDAPADALGRAASPDGEAGAGGAPAQPAPPPARAVPAPLAVVLDNAGGYPQQGLAQATWTAEIPVEGGVTRLLPFFDAEEPREVGPIRSARPYMIDLADDAAAVLVHVGGSPAAQARLAGDGARNLDAMAEGPLFARDPNRGRAPVNTFAAGAALRAAAERYVADEDPRLVAQVRPTAPDGAPSATEVRIDWGGAYASGFRLEGDTGRYRWIRYGEPASAAGGAPILLDAVLLARLDVVPIPGDPAGRVSMDVTRGGDATLLLRGRRVEGTWRLQDGVRFVAEDGTEIALEGMRRWVAFVPTGQTVTVRP